MGATLCQLFWEMVWIFTVVTFINKSYVRNRISEHLTTGNALMQLCLVLNEGIKFFYEYLIVWPFIFFYYSFSHYTAVFEYDSLRTRTYFRSLLLKKRLRVCCQPVVVVVFNVARNLVIVVKFTLQSVFSNSHQNPRHASERSREDSLELYSVLWSDWPTSKQKAIRHGNHFATRVCRRNFSGGEKRRPKIPLCPQARAAG